MPECHWFAGMESATWPVQIKRDNLEEETEKFKVQLKNPINAVIGENDKTLLHIFNMHKGRSTMVHIQHA